MSIGKHLARAEEGAAALLASLKSSQRTRRGWSGGKGDPFARGTSIAALAGPWQPLLPRDALAVPTCPNGRRGPRNHAQPVCRPTDNSQTSLALARDDAPLGNRVSSIGSLWATRAGKCRLRCIAWKM